jgi:hypothetical protein
MFSYLRKRHVAPVAFQRFSSFLAKLYIGACMGKDVLLRVLLLSREISIGYSTDLRVSAGHYTQDTGSTAEDSGNLMERTNH